MATVTNTDYVRDFSGVADTDPYTVSGLSEIGGPNNRVISGALCNINGASSGTTVDWRNRVTGTATATLLRASAEYKGTGTYNVKGPAIFNASGAGYFLGINYNQFAILYLVAADASQSALASFNIGAGFADGNRIHLTLDTTTGDLRCYNEASLMSSLNATDTTYNTGMMPGWGMLGHDGGMPGFISIGADYLSGGGGGGIVKHASYYYRQRRAA